MGPSFRAGIVIYTNSHAQNPEKFIMNLQIFQDFAIICVFFLKPALKDGPSQND